MLIFTVSILMSNQRVEKEKKACDSGDAAGCFSLGVMYYNGDGIRQNKQKSKELFGKACDGGNTKDVSIIEPINIYSQASGKFIKDKGYINASAVYGESRKYG